MGIGEQRERERRIERCKRDILPSTQHWAIILCYLTLSLSCIRPSPTRSGIACSESSYYTVAANSLPGAYFEMDGMNYTK